MIVQALTLTLRLAVIVSLILLVVGVPLAYWLAFSRMRWKFFVEAIVSLPIVLPPTVLGFYLLVALGPRSFIGRWWMAFTGEGLVFSFSGLVVASLLLNLPFFVQPLASAMAGVEGRYLEAAATLGAGPAARVWRVALPLAWRGLVSGAVLSFAHTMGEFGVVLMVGGDLPGRTRTASIAVFDQVQALDLAGAHRTALFLIILAFGVLTAVALLKGARRSWSF